MCRKLGPNCGYPQFWFILPQNWYPIFCFIMNDPNNHSTMAAMLIIEEKLLGATVSRKSVWTKLFLWWDLLRLAINIWTMHNLWEHECQTNLPPMSWFDSNKTIFILECSTTIKWSKIVVAYYDMISTHLAAMGIGLCQFASNCIWQMLMKIRSWSLITPVVFWSVSHCWQVLSSMWHLCQECNVRQPKSEVLMNSFSSSLQLKDEVKLLIFSQCAEKKEESIKM